MLEFTQTQKETVAIVADAVDRFQRSFKESVLIDELIPKEQVELHFYRENMVIGKGASSHRHSPVGLLGNGCEVVCAELTRECTPQPRIQATRGRNVTIALFQNQPY
jgi:hypothetical protein